MNIRIEERHNHDESCIPLEVSRKTQKVEIYLATEGFGLAFFNRNLGHIFVSNVFNEFGVMLRGKGPHEPEKLTTSSAFRTHSLMFYTDPIQYNIVGDTNVPLLSCFLFISELKAGDIKNTGQYMNYHTYSKLHFRRLLKSSFHSVQIDLRDTSRKEGPVVSLGITRLVLMFRKTSSIHF